MVHQDSDADVDDIDAAIAEWTALRPDFDATPIGVFGRVTRLHTRQRAVLNSIYDEFDLTLPSFDVLANLLRSGSPHRKTAGELANSSMLTTGGITFRLDRMEQQGLIERQRSSTDRRVVYAQLTAHGKATIERVIEKHLTAEAEMLADLSPVEVRQLATLLKKAVHSTTKRQNGPGDAVGADSN